MSDEELLGAALEAARSGVQIDEIGKFVRPLLVGFQTNAPFFPPGKKLFRARVCGKPTNLSEIGCPPSHRVGWGRANCPGEPVFYCANAEHAAIFEVQPRAGDTFVVSEWMSTSDMLVNHVGYTRDAFQRLSSLRSHASWSDKGHATPEGVAFDRVANLLAKLFVERVDSGSEWRYRLTTAVARLMMSDEMFAGLLYPSIAMRANADNFAIKREFAERNFKLKKVTFAVVDSVGDFDFNIKRSDTATTFENDGTICWKGRLDQWVLRKEGETLRLVAEQHGWVARDSDGNIVEPE